MDHLKRLPQLPPRELAMNAAILAGLTTLTVGAIAWCIRDYQEYLALGPGGLPHDIRGWAAVNILRPFALSKNGAKQTSTYPSEGAHEEIRSLPNRMGERASVGGIIPHRQLSQHSPEEMKQYIKNLLKNVVTQNSGLLEERLSLYERHNLGVFVRENVLSGTNPPVPEAAILARGECGHVHPDFSVHLNLSPADARHVIEKGWGEKHRLSKPETSIFQFKKMHVADAYILLYGPRNEEEVEVLSKILHSSIRFMTGRDDVEMPQWKTLLTAK